MGLTAGATVLDPMMGSGTTCVEAALIGAHAIGIDASPFCVFMADTKISALTMSLERTQAALQNLDEVFAYFSEKFGIANPGPGFPHAESVIGRVLEEGEEYVVAGQRMRNRDTRDTYSLLLLAFLDTMGYVQRSPGKRPIALFRGVLERYLHTCTKFQDIHRSLNFQLGSARCQCGDARALHVDSDSVDGILFSPPYSFAIDYVENDAFHLKALGVDRRTLTERMIGIRGGKKLSEKYACYLQDMRQVLSECYRVLKPGRSCVIVIGTNSNQLSKLFAVPKEDVIGLHEILRKEAVSLGFAHVTEISRLINGISNTMREEVIVFLDKPRNGLDRKYIR